VPDLQLAHLLAERGRRPPEQRGGGTGAGEEVAA
jgi:hypothetical protein